MLFEPAGIKDAWVVTQDPYCDERGRFARVFCKREFAAHGVEFDMVQANSARSRVAGTLRGLHYQPRPHAEAKLVRCSRGTIYDVIVDMRPDSPTYLKYVGIEMTPENGKMLYVPPCCAHGYVTLQADSEICYLANEYYVPGSEVGIRYNDPAVEIVWPIPAEVMNERDRNWPLLNGVNDDSCG